MTQPPPTSFEACVLGRELLVSWDKFSSAADMPMKARNIEDLFIAFALASHAHRLADVVFELLERERTAESVPLIRMMFECALTAMWTAQVEGATEAFFNAQAHSRRIFLERLPSLGRLDITSEELEKAIADMDEMDDLVSNASARFEHVCLDLEPGGQAAYTLYRLMSKLSHPSELIGDKYLTVTDVAPFIARKETQDAEPTQFWALIAVSALVWAGSAVDFWAIGHPRRSLLQATETRLGIKRVLRPSERARHRKRPAK